MKRYLLFEGYEFYPAGGWLDFVKDFDSVDEAKANVGKSYEDIWAGWFQIVDLETNAIVESTNS